MKNRIIALVLTLVMMCLALTSCQIFPIGDDTDEGNTVTDSRYPRGVVTPNTTADTVITSFRDGEYNYYIYLLGTVERIPLEDTAGDLYDGSFSKKEFSTEECTKESISKTLTSETTKATEVSSSITASVTASTGINLEVIEDKVEVGMAGTTATGSSISSTRSESITKASEYSISKKETTEFVFSKDAKHGYYRYILMGDINVYGVLIYDVNEEKYYSTTYSIIYATYHYLDYSEKSTYPFDSEKKLEFNISQEDIDKLVPPTNVIHPTYRFEYDSGYAEKDVDDGNVLKDYDKVDISSMKKYMNSNFELHFTVNVLMYERDDGYQEVYVKNSNGETIGYKKDIEHAGDIQSWDKKWANINFTISGEKCTDILTLYYGANGNDSDDWVRCQAQVYVTATVKN